MFYSSFVAKVIDIINFENEFSTFFYKWKGL